MSAEVIPYYVEINMITFILLIIIAINVNKRTAVFNTEIMYKLALVSTLIAITADSLATALEGAMYPGAIEVNWILDIVYFSASLAIPYFFWGYIRNMGNSRARNSDPIMYVMAVPVVIYSFICILSIKTGWVFTIDELNHYSRGPLRLGHGIIAGALLLVAFGYSLYYYKRSRLPEEIGKYIVILPLFPLLGVIGRNIIQGSNLIWASTTIGFIIILINGQNSLIGLDSLTKLNNKGRCDEYIDMKLENIPSGKTLNYTIIDINYFKQINDSYGHVEGDRALKDFSRLLKEVGRNNKDFIGRFGGDEFIMISERKSGESIEKELKALSKKVERYNANSKLPYKISFSYGTASATKAHPLSAHELLTMADENMYQQKQSFHAQVAIN